MNNSWLIHNSHDLNFRTPFGAVPTNEVVNIRFLVKKQYQVKKILLKYYQDNEETVISIMNKSPLQSLSIAYSDYTVYEQEIKKIDRTGIVWYYFEIYLNNQIIYYGKNKKGYGGIGSVSDTPIPYQITVYDNTKVPPPDWFKESTIYQIFVDRFYNGNDNGKVLNPKKNSFIHSHWDNLPYYIKDENKRVIRWDFYGGNLFGIQKKLDYLKGLGVNVIYLNPIFESPSNHKYDTSDYHKIDPMFGDEKMFKDLCTTAEQMGISIILDGVFSHTGSDSIYFNKEGNYPSVGAYQSKESIYYPWYRFKEFPNKYECWWGVDTLPNVNELEPSYKEFLITGEKSVLKYWHNLGAKGWRLDVADELPDQFIKEFRSEMKSLNVQSILIGEVWEDASNKISYGSRREYFLGEELDSVTNYPFRKILIDFIKGIIEAEEVHLALMTLYENYPKSNFYSLVNLLGSHDIQRILTVLQERLPHDWQNGKKRDTAIKRLKLLSLWQMTFPGVPMIYYGDEVGLEGGEDPDNRRTYPWGKENKDLLNWYRKIIAFRNQYEVVRKGDWGSVYSKGDIYGYYRKLESEGKIEYAFILLNRNINVSQAIKLNNILEQLYVKDISEEGIWKEPLDSEHPIAFLNNSNSTINLDPLSGKVLIYQKG